MKRFAAILMATVCTLSLAACGSKQPSLEEVEKAIAEGNVTVEDALEKGWVSQEWVDDYYDETTVDAANKSEVFHIDAFTTKTISGEEFTDSDISDMTYIAFLDPEDEATEEFYQELCAAYEGVKENGGEIIAFTKSETKHELFEEAPFPVVIYNDSVAKALPEGTADMVTELANTGSWYANDYFITAWSITINADDLAKAAKDLATVDLNKDEGSKDGEMTVGIIG